MKTINKIGLIGFFLGVFVIIVSCNIVCGVNINGTEVDEVVDLTVNPTTDGLNQIYTVIELDDGESYSKSVNTYSDPSKSVYTQEITSINNNHYEKLERTTTKPNGAGTEYNHKIITSQDIGLGLNIIYSDQVAVIIHGVKIVNEPVYKKINTYKTIKEYKNIYSTKKVTKTFKNCQGLIKNIKSAKKLMKSKRCEMTNKNFLKAWKCFKNNKGTFKIKITGYHKGNGAKLPTFKITVTYKVKYVSAVKVNTYKVNTGCKSVIDHYKKIAYVY